MLFLSSSIDFTLLVEIIIGFLITDKSIFIPKSSLLTITKCFLSFTFSKSSKSSWVKHSLPSKTKSTNSALSKTSKDLETPICSTISVVSLIPAVSIKLRVTLPKLISTSLPKPTIPFQSLIFQLSCLFYGFL